MSFLLDTNVVSRLRQNRPVNQPALAWAATNPRSAMFVSVVTVMEIEVGVLRLERRDARQGRALRRWLENSVLEAFDGRILGVDTAVARRAAALQVPDPAPVADSLIAATALEHALTVVTHNVRDFTFPGVQLYDPWRESKTDR